MPTFGAKVTGGAKVASAETAFNSAINYSDGWALVSSFTYPTALFDGAAKCPGAGGVNIGLCYAQATGNKASCWAVNYP